MASVQTEVRELVDYIRSLGFQCAIEKDGHWHIYRNGKPVLRQGKSGAPVTLPGTPSDVKWRHNTISMLKTARVIEDDPLKMQQRELAKRDPQTKAERERARAALAERKQIEAKHEPSERQLRIRDAVKDTLDALEAPRIDFVRLARQTALAKGLRVPPNDSALMQAMRRLLESRFVSADWILDIFETTLADLGAIEALKEEKKTAPAASPATPEKLTVEALTSISRTDRVTRVVGLDRPARMVGEKYQCGCGTFATDLRGLKAHVRAAHVEAQCPHCQRWFASSSLGQHLKHAHRELPPLPEPEPMTMKEAAAAIQGEIDRQTPEVVVTPNGKSQARISIEAIEDLKALFYVQGVLDGLNHSAAAEMLNPLIERAVAAVS